MMESELKDIPDATNNIRNEYGRFIGKDEKPLVRKYTEAEEKMIAEFLAKKENNE